MRVFSGLATRVTMVMGSLAVLGAATMAAATPAAATPSSPTPSPLPVATVSAVGSASPLPAFSSCAYGQPANTPFVVLVNAQGQKAGFEATGPYRFAPRHITGPFIKLANYSNCRVWLHESGNPNAPGPSKCFSPYRFHSSSAIAKAWEHAGSLVITGNTNRCP
jgi:hypothetical protein